MSQKVTCPHCGSKNCFESTEEATSVISYLCFKSFLITLKPRKPVPPAIKIFFFKS